MDSFTSVSVLLSGIMAARFGLWVSDLSTTQILQETADEHNRGSLGGVQGALNSAMDTIKFTLVIALPEDDTFGWLIMASYTLICVGAISYSTFAVKYWKELPLAEANLTSDISSSSYKTFENEPEQ